MVARARVPSFENAIGIAKLSVSDITPDAFEREYVSRAVPAVLTDVTAAWPCASEWKLSHFAEAHGDVEIVADDGTPEKLRCTLREYVARMDADAIAADRAADEAESRPDDAPPSPPPPGPPYLRTWNFLDDRPEWASGFESDSPYFRDYFHRLRPEWRPPFTWLFLGPRGAKTRLHVDVWHTDAWLTMLEGRKKFIMYHPAHLEHVHDEASGEYVDLHAPDLSKFPRFRDAIPIEFVLEEGETVYIPRKWPHYAVALDATASLTVNFCSAANRRRVVEKCVAYANRRDACEHMLGRSLRASDNVMKFCVHGGELNRALAASILGLTPEAFEAKAKERRRLKLMEEQRKADEADAEEEAEAAEE